LSDLKAAAIVAAAGQGKRMGGQINKQYLLLQDKPVVVHSLLLFQLSSIINKIILVVPGEDVADCRETLVAQYGLSKVLVVAGGKERQDSVFNGLKQVKDSQVVVVHDGARPLLTNRDLEEVVKNALIYGGAVLAVQVKDTVKVVSEEKFILSTPARSSLWAAQTPQAFRRELLWAAYASAMKQGFYGTDDASLVEAQGYAVRVVPGNYENIKVTTPEDLIVAENILKRREANAGGNRL
jgi:2-C-methyl-D-erythritol 4-phosphate cytidylyltransferase